MLVSTYIIKYNKYNDKFIYPTSSIDFAALYYTKIPVCNR